MTADLIFTGGRVFDVDQPDAAVAVEGERIVAVGGAELMELRGPRTEVVDLAGGLLVPGFVDAHIHPVQGGVERLSCDLAGARTARQYDDIVGAYARAHPDAEWITGGGWSMEAFPGGLPEASSLDAVVADRPAFLLNRDHHGAWVNTAALRAAGIDEHTPDPGDGRIERDADGRPTGALHEGAVDLVMRLLPPPRLDDLVAGLLEAQRYLHSLGITGWQDAIVGEYANIADAGDAYLAASADGTLTARVVGALWWDRAQGVEQVDRLLARGAEMIGPRFRATSVKIMLDGVVENFTAAMREPYLDGDGGQGSGTGISFVSAEAMAAAVTALDAAGVQVHVHAIGDRAVGDALDAFEAAQAANGISDLRHHIAHIQVIDPRDVPRFGRLGVAANMQAFWAAHEPQMDDLTIPFLGPERTTWQYPFRSLLDTGARLVMGSDWPVSSPDPLWAIHVAVNRVMPPEDRPAGAPPFLPEQRLDVGTAVRAYTQGSAWVNHQDDGGRIAVGCLADLAVLDRDVLSIAPEDISSTRVLATFVGGSQVFAD